MKAYKNDRFSTPGLLASGLIASCTTLLFTAPIGLCVLPHTETPVETNIDTLTSPKGEFSLELDTAAHPTERKEIETFLDSIEKQWNSHNLEALMNDYAFDYNNNDGLDKKAVSDLTKEFWEQYPDAKSSSQTREIRIEGSYATVTSRDIAYGTAANEVPTITGKGELHSVSEGQLYLKKFADGWKIIGDHINYEKVKVAYGLAKHIDLDFTAPEQVEAGKRYAAKLEVKLPNGLAAVAEITNQNLQYPSVQQVFPNVAQTEIWKSLDSNTLEKDDFILERVLESNKTNHNELLMTKIAFTNAAKNSLVGFEFLTRRLNVIPSSLGDSTIAEKPDNKAGDTKTAQKDVPAKNAQTEAKPKAETSKPVTTTKPAVRHSTTKRKKTNSSQSNN